MQPTSTTWRTLWAAGARLECRATIAGTVYTDISAPVIARGLMQDGLSAGNAVSASCALSLREPGQIPKAAAVAVEMRLTDGNDASEWLPAGTFYVSRRGLDPVSGRLTLECYDALLKANAVWEPSAGSWPRSMIAVAAELAALIGVAQDPRNAIDAVMMAEPAAGATVRDALGTIAAAHGGNWIITPEGKLRLVPLLGSGDAVAALGVLGRMDAGEAMAITGVRCASEGESLLSGDETGAVVTLNGGLPAWAAALAEAWEGETWQRFELSGALYDPAAELGDALIAGAEGEVRGVLCGETVTLGAQFKGDARAPGPEEVADEYPYIGAAAKTLTVAKAYANTVSAAAAQALNSALTQTEIFNRLTGNGTAQGLYIVDGQLYVNASFINTGILNADLIQAGMLTSENGRLTLNTETGVIRSYSDPSDLPAPTMAEIVNSGITFYTHDPTGEFTYVIGRLLSGFNSNNVPNLYLEVDPNGYRGGILNINNGIAYLTLQGDTVYVSRLQSSRIGGTWIGSAIGVEYGGTGANNAADARTNLGAQQDMGFYIDQQGYICQRIGSDA